MNQINPRNAKQERDPEIDRLLTTDETAALLNMAANTLAKGRMEGNRRHPPHIKIGRLVRYSTRDLSEFIRRRTASNAAR